MCVFHINHQASTIYLVIYAVVAGQENIRRNIYKHLQSSNESIENKKQGKYDKKKGVFETGV